MAKTLPPDKYQLIFERWKASLRDRDRSTEHVVSNFDELFDNLLRAGASFEEAYEILPTAIKAHQPAPGLIRSFWSLQKSRNKKFNLSEKEFTEKWCGDIADMGKNSFFNYFPMAIATPPDDKEYTAGKISEREYRLMRQHADQFRPLDLNLLPNPSEDLLFDEAEILKLFGKRGDNE
jgi:hypothetical protein